MNGVEAVVPRDLLSIIEVLVPIWQRVLARDSITIDDSFIDLGGNQARADALLAEIGRTLRWASPIAAIDTAPTIASQAVALLTGMSVEQPRILPVRPGTNSPPLLVLPGLAGRTGDLVSFAVGIQCGHPVYLGHSPATVPGGDQGIVSIEDRAARYLRALRELQPQGPYAFAGYSMGGMVALEMARQLVDCHQAVPLLVMIDSYPQPRCWPLSDRARVFTRTSWRHAVALARLPPSRSLPYLAQRIRGLYARSTGGSPAAAGLAPAAERARQADYLAYYRYQPAAYHGSVRYICSTTHPDFPDNPATVWKKLVDHLSVDTVPGDHLGIVREYRGGPAGLLCRYVAETFAPA